MRAHDRTAEVLDHHKENGEAAHRVKLRHVAALRRNLTIPDLGLPTHAHAEALATVYQHGPYGLRTANKARAAVAVLLDHGQVRRLPPGTEYDGRARREVWELAP
jgi:hypothetical protein